MDKKRFGQQVRQLRKRQGLTQIELARKVGMEVTYLSRMETATDTNGKGVLLETALRLAEGLGVGLGALLDIPSCTHVWQARCALCGILQSEAEITS